MKFFLLFLSLATFGFDDLERNIKKNIILSSPDFSQIDNLTKNQILSPPKDPFTLYQDPVEDSPVVTLMIRENTLLIDPKNKEEKKLTKDIFVRGKFLKKTGHYQIFNKENKPVYEIRGIDAILVEDAIDLDPIPKTYITYEKNELNVPLDKKFSLTHSVSLNKQTLDASYFSELFDNPENTADGFKLDYKIFHKTDFPIALGLVASFESGDYSGSGFNGFFIGAGVKTPWRMSESILLEAHLVFERSLYLKVNSTSFESYYFQGNLEAIYKDRYFLNVSLNSATFSADDQWIMSSAGSNTGSGFGIGLGIKFYSDINI